MKDLSESVVVITGASSGIGRATAHAFARAGATVVVNARGDDKLEDVVQECRDLGGDCVAIPCDVSSESDVQALADEVVEAFGRIDVWVNNAAVTAFGRIDEMPYELCRQVIETNLLGYLHGCRAAIGQFRRQAEGVLINVASVAGKVGQPFTSAYSASKFGIIGLSDSVRMEVRKDPGIHVCTVLPPSIDTPLFQHGANYLGRKAQPMPPIYTADDVAETILALARRPRREVAIGAAGKLLVAMQRLAPALTEQMVADSVERKHFSQEPDLDELGNLIEPVDDDYEVSGGWKERQAPGSHPLKAVAGVVVALAGVCGIYALTKAVWSSGGDRSVGGSADWPAPSAFEIEAGTDVPQGAYTGV